MAHKYHRLLPHINIFRLYQPSREPLAHLLLDPVVDRLIDQHDHGQEVYGVRESWEGEYLSDVLEVRVEDDRSVLEVGYHYVENLMI